MADLDKTQEQIQKYLEQRLNKTERVIAKQYAVLLEDIRLELTKLYEKYEVGGKLTYAEMAKYDRMKRFLEYINELLILNYKDMRKAIVALLGETYLQGYYMMGWALETATLSKLAYSAVPAATITAMINNPITGLTLNDRLNKNRADIVYRIQQEITQGLVQGESYGTMAKRLKTSLEGDVNKALRIVRTEAHRVNESAKLDSAVHANKNGIIMLKSWKNRMDERSRPSHKAANGQTVAVEKDFKVGSARGSAPGQLSGGAKENVNCACVVTYEIKTVKKPDAKDLDGMVFDTWMKERVKA